MEEFNKHKQSTGKTLNEKNNPLLAKLTPCHLSLKTYGLYRPEATGNNNIIVSREGNSVGYLGHSSSPL